MVSFFVKIWKNLFEKQEILDVSNSLHPELVHISLKVIEMGLTETRLSTPCSNIK